MEKIPAASAMDWSIDLDKGLRSKHPQTRIQALESVGPRLRELGISSNPSKAVADMFGLVPGEDRVFAETMVLRLADEFKNGDNSVRARVVRALVLEYRELGRKGRGYDGVLAKAWVVDREELLRRVKAVYDKGDARARALALRMFGCMASLAEDSVQVRYMVLASLNSSSAMEVKAALFTAGCFCWLSEDFSCITLEVLRRFISSARLGADIILAAIKAFAKLHCTLAVIHRAYQVGKMLLDALEDALKAEMLFSLSRLASKSTILFSDQVDLLILVLRNESSVLTKTASLKCLYFMFHRSTCHFPVSRNIFNMLLHIIEDTDLPLCCKCDALSILRKVLHKKARDILHMDGPDLRKLILSVESTTHSSCGKMKDTALDILVNTVCILKGARADQSNTTQEKLSFACTEHQAIANNMMSSLGENGFEMHVDKLTTVMVNHITALVNQVITEQNNEVASKKDDESFAKLKINYKASFSLMLKLAKAYPSAGLLALDKLRGLIQNLGRINDRLCSGTSDTCVESPQAKLVLDNTEDNVEQLPENAKASSMDIDFEQPKFASSIGLLNSGRRTSSVSELVLLAFRFSNACLNVLYKTAIARRDLYPVVRVLIECIQQDASHFCSTYEYLCLFMHSCIAYRITNSNQELGDPKVHPTLFFTPSLWVVQEVRALGITKMLVRKSTYWEAYKSAIYCYRQGLWFTASFVFKKLTDAFESSSFSFWFKSLLLLASSEIEIKLLLFPMATVKFIDELQAEGNLNNELHCMETDIDTSLVGFVDLHNNEAKLRMICSRICSSGDILASNDPSDCVYFFQRWFISLRSTFLETLIDVLGILVAQKDIKQSEGEGEDRLTAVGKHVNDQVLALANCSTRLGNLAKNYDLLAASYMDMDHQSFASIARLALMCSLLAFCLAFSCDFSNLPGCENVILDNLVKRFSHSSKLQDLLNRVCWIDKQTASQLQQFMTASSEEVDFLQCSTRMNCSGHVERDSYLLCQFAVSELLRVHEEAKGVTDKEDILSSLDRGVQFLSIISQKLMELPFQVPRYFFRARPCLGAELFIFDSNPANRHDISISPGFQLSLNLCMQWKKVLERTSIRIAKLYCILAASSTSCLDVVGITSKQFKVQKTGELVELHNVLLQYVKSNSRKGRAINVVRADMGLVTAFACFEPTERGQGFSDCLLDVSAFPEGSYQIKWHGCCLDHHGSYWSLLPLNGGVPFSIRKAQVPIQLNS